MRKHLVRVLVVLFATAIGCSDDAGNTNPTPNSPTGGGTSGGGTSGGGTSGGGTTGGTDGGTTTAPTAVPVNVSGKVVDYQTNMPVAGSATVATVGIMPAPKVTVTGSDYLVEAIPPQTAFYLLAGSPPDYASTYSPVITVANSDVTFDAKVVKQTYVADLAKAFAVTPTAGTGTLIARIIDDKGMPIANVPKAAITLTGAKGPYFFDATGKPAPNATATSTLGLVVFFDVQPGAATLTAPANSGWTLLAGAVPTGAAAVTLADVAAVAGNGTTTMPTNVSFSKDIVPIFTNRGCVNCHSGGGPGKDLGGLQLDGGLTKVYSEVTQELSPNYNKVRVDLKEPAKSLLLTLPSYENPPDPHPTATFASPADPDYQKILSWITAGAKLN